MKKITRLIPLLWLLLFSLAPAQAPVSAADSQSFKLLYLPQLGHPLSIGVWQLGPSVGRALAVGQDPFSPSVVYAMTFGSGMYKSTDSGASWKPISRGIGYLTLQAMALDPNTPNTLYTGTYGEMTVPYSGVYKTTNGGVSWKPTGEMMNVWNGRAYNKPVVYTLVVDPLDSMRIYAGTRMRGLPEGSLGGGGVFRSENGGATWEPVNKGLPYEDLYVYDLAVSSTTPGLVYAALHQSGLYRSTNFGYSWSKVEIPDGVYSGRAIAIDPTNPAVLYFGAMKNQSLYRSSNYGASWSLYGNGGWDIVVGGASPDPYHSGRVYTGIIADALGNQLMRRAGTGGIWTAVAPMPTWGRVAFAPDGQAAYVGVDYRGVYKTTNGGQNWNPSSQGLSGFSVTGLAVSPTNPNWLAASLYGLGVYTSSDGGANWVPSLAGLTSPNVLGVTIDPNNPSLLFATTSDAGVFRSTNSGASWSAMSTGYPTFAAAEASENVSAAGETAAFDPLENRPLPEPFDLAGDLDASPDSGPSLLASMVPGNLIAISPLDRNTILLGTAGKGVLRLVGDTWVRTTFSSGTCYAIVFDRSAIGRVVVGNNTESGGILVSTDGGQTFSRSNAGMEGRTVYSLAQHPRKHNVFLAGTDSGTFLSTDRGVTWAPSGLEGQSVRAVSITDGGIHVYFAATSTGAYYSENGPGAWNPLHEVLENVGIQGVTRDPITNSLYFYTRLGGVVKVGQR